MTDCIDWLNNIVLSVFLCESYSGVLNKMLSFAFSPSQTRVFKKTNGHGDVSFASDNMTTLQISPYACPWSNWCCSSLFLHLDDPLLGQERLCGPCGPCGRSWWVAKRFEKVVLFGKCNHSMLCVVKLFVCGAVIMICSTPKLHCLITILDIRIWEIGN